MTIAPPPQSDGAVTRGGPVNGDSSVGDPTLGDPTLGDPTLEPGGQPVVRAAMRRRKARQRRRKATIVQSGLSIVFVVALIALAVVGWRSSLKLTGGRDLEVTDPAAPGYVAEVKPTTVDLLAVTGEDGELATMLLVIGDADSATTTIVPISAWMTLWQFEDANPASARTLFSSGGIDVLQIRLGADLTFGATDAVTATADQIEELAAAVGPVTVNLPDNVLVDDGTGGSVVRYPSGPLTLQPDEIMEFLSIQGQSEAELNRSLRLGQVWDALLAQPGAQGGADGSAAVDSVVGELIAGLGETELSVQLLPTNEVPLPISPPVSLDQVDRVAMSTWVPTYVPLPISAYPGQRATVNLLNGSSSSDAVTTVVPRVVAGGGEIALTGNAESFDVATSTVVYSNIESKTAADAIAAQLGLTATQVEDSATRVDVTVVVGKDLVP